MTARPVMPISCRVGGVSPSPSCDVRIEMQMVVTRRAASLANDVRSPRTPLLVERFRSLDLRYGWGVVGATTFATRRVALVNLERHAAKVARKSSRALSPEQKQELLDAVHRDGANRAQGRGGVDRKKRQ